MRTKVILAAGACVLIGSIAVRLAAQAPAAPQTPPAPGGAAGPDPAAGRGAPAGGGAGGGGQSFPAQQRTLAAQDVIDRGKIIYEINCRACHGADLRGGDGGGPNLLRSEVALTDQHGELIGQVVKTGRQNPGMSVMPPLGLPEADLVAVSEYIHAITATSRGQGAPPAGPPVELNIVVGDAREGQAYFAAKCTPCHSATGDMAGIASRVPNPMQLQNAWVAGTSGRGGSQTMVTVALPSGDRIEGPLVRVDDFLVVVALPDGRTRSFARSGDVPKVEIKDPKAAHLKLLPTYTDKDIHDVTAYLVTLK